MTSWYTGAGACLAMGVVLGGMSGCAAVGSGQFSCPGRPEGVRCIGARQVYDLTQETDDVAATAEGALGNNPSRAAAARRAQGVRSVGAAQAGETQSAPETPTSPQAVPATPGGQGAALWPLAERPTPVRTPAQVMRVWVAPWEDTRGVLHIGGYHYVEVVARRWTIGGPVNTEPARLFSINEPIFDTAPSPESEDQAAGAAPVFGTGAGTQLESAGN